jgi:hypothetical protein
MTISIPKKQPFMLTDNIVVVATQMRLADSGAYRNTYPNLLIMFGGTETDEGVQALPPCSIAIYGEKAIEELQAACAFALLPKTIQKLEGT